MKKHFSKFPISLVIILLLLSHLPFLKGEETSYFDSLFIQASAARYNHQHFVEPAREKIIKLGEKILPFLVSKIKSRQPREYHALKKLFRKIDGKIAGKYLADEIAKMERNTFSGAVEYLGLSRCPYGLKILLPYLKQDSSWIKLAAIKGIGELKDSTALSELIPFVSNTDKRIRWQTAAALGKIATPSAFKILLKMLTDDYQMSSHTAYRALLTKLKTDSTDYTYLLKNENNSPSPLLEKLKLKFKIITQPDSSKYDNFQLSFITENRNPERFKIQTNDQQKKKSKNSTFHEKLIKQHSLLDTSLALQVMDRDDIFFPVKTEKYPFVFPIISQLFQSPLQQIKFNEKLAADFNNFPVIDFTNIRREFSIHDSNFMNSIIKSEEIKSIEDFIIETKKAIATFDSAFIDYSPEEREDILNYFRSRYDILSSQQKHIPPPATPHLKTNIINHELHNLINSRLAERREYKKTDKFYKEDLSNFKPAYFIKAGSRLYYSYLTLIHQIKSGTIKLETADYMTELGRIRIGSDDNDEYEGEYFLIIDPGGDDLYSLNNSEQRFSFLIDFRGDDLYLTPQNFGPAAAFNGISFHYDERGNDTYKCSRFSLGSSLLGFTALLDLSGNDNYISSEFSQASAIFGFAALWDKNGLDNYSSGMKSQGYSETAAIAVLADDQGNDIYTLVSKEVDLLRYGDHYNSMGQGFSIGERDHAGGGISLLLDKEGNDLYLSDIFGQGAAYWLASGTIIDKKGNDTYSSYQYSIGSGVHLAFGTVLDYQGDDSYKAKGVSLGCGHDYASGILLDGEGDDSYLAESLSIGSGNANAFSLFIDFKGDDIYGTRQKSTLGFSDWRRDTGYIGIFIDGEGDDRYGTPHGANKSIWYNGTWGNGIDY